MCHTTEHISQAIGDIQSVLFINQNLHLTNQMTIEELINEYKQMASMCNNVDYTDKKSVKSNNKSVTRMYQIVEKIKTEFGGNGVTEFAKLVDFNQDRTNIWASVQMLEKMTVNENTKVKALAIIKEEAKQSLGMEYWLKDYLDKKKYGT